MRAGIGKEGYPNSHTSSKEVVLGTTSQQSVKGDEEVTPRDTSSGEGQTQCDLRSTDDMEDGRRPSGREKEEGRPMLPFQGRSRLLPYRFMYLLSSFEG